MRLTSLVKAIMLPLPWVNGPMSNWDCGVNRKRIIPQHCLLSSWDSGADRTTRTRTSTSESETTVATRCTCGMLVS